MRIRRPHLPRPSLGSVDRSMLRDPRLALIAVPFVAVLLLMTSNHGASPLPIAASSTTTTTAPSGDPGSGADVAVEGATAEPPADPALDSSGFGNMVDDDGHSSGSGSSGSGSSGSSRRSSASVTVPAAVQSATTINPALVTTVPGETTTTVPGTPATTTTTVPGGLPPAVVSEAASPAVMGVVGVGVAALVLNGLVLVRRRRRTGGER